MDLRDLLQRVARWLDASPSEVAGLLGLLAGGVVLTLYVVAVPRGLGVQDGMPLDAVPVTTAEVTVHVAGAVQHPGLVTVPADARVADAIAQAGGATLQADVGGLNLARVVTDGERIVVPAHVTGLSGSSADPPIGAWRPDGTLDLNLADATQLQELPGVGPVLAERILAWRDQHGPFTQVAQLREVAGIGEKTFQSLADLVAV